MDKIVSETLKFGATKTFKVPSIFLFSILLLITSGCGKEKGPTYWTVKVTFEVNGGSWISPVDIISGSTITLPAAPNKTGYLFEDWFYDKALNSKFDEKKSITSNLTLYAKWTELFTITFNSKGGSPVPPLSILKGTTTSIVLPENPTRPNYKFLGWYKNSDLTDKFDKAQILASSITLYAKWIQIFKITFNSNEGTEIPEQEVVSGSTLTLPPNPTRANYVFKGWYLNSNLATKFDETQIITSSFTLYAKWLP